MYYNEVVYNKLEESNNFEKEMEEIRKGKNKENKIKRYKRKRILWNLSDHHE
jgi:hypothetical protein